MKLMSQATSRIQVDYKIEDLWYNYIGDGNMVGISVASNKEWKFVLYNIKFFCYFQCFTQQKKFE